MLLLCMQVGRTRTVTMAAGIPATMRALETPEGGPISALYINDKRPTPKAGTENAAPAEVKPVLVKVEYAALNPVDPMVMAGHMGNQIWPFVLGVDFSGTIAELSDPSSNLKVGDKVWGYTGLNHPGSGTLAEYCTVPFDCLAKVPDGVSMEQAASIGTTALTGALGIWEHLGLSQEKQAGNEDTTVLIYGASGGVGQYAAQLAKQAGVQTRPSSKFSEIAVTVCLTAVRIGSAAAYTCAVYISVWQRFCVADAICVAFIVSQQAR
jgi:NADPH:quinone reductase-like Zn-dependent oxidoreductase